MSGSRRSASAWRPYYDGSWGYTRYGWTWHGRDRWAWPTHHYGRWGFNGSFWYLDSGQGLGPGVGQLGLAPGYVSWSPLGWDGLPAIGFGHHGTSATAVQPVASWTVVPRDHFGHRRPVRVHAIDGDRLDDSIRRRWSVQALPPATSTRLRGAALQRASASQAIAISRRRHRPASTRRPVT